MSPRGDELNEPIGVIFGNETADDWYAMNSYRRTDQLKRQDLQVGSWRYGFSRWSLMVSLLLFPALTGCAKYFAEPDPAHIINTGIANPITVAMVDRQWIMDVVSDELDNYFRIAREERIRVVDAVITEGWIETHPQIGSSLLEPWKGDSTPGFEKLHATLQTVRRTARARIIPHYDSYLIEVQVNKELEDRPQPLHSSISSRQLRHDNSVDQDRDEIPIIQAEKGWIPMGRDLTLEQKILQNISSRVTKHCEDQSVQSPR